MKKYLCISSAAVGIGALRVNSVSVSLLNLYFTKSKYYVNALDKELCLISSDFENVSNTLYKPESHWSCRSPESIHPQHSRVDNSKATCNISKF